MILEVNNLSKTYISKNNNYPVINNVSFNINKAEIVVLLGPSGSGKSTLLNILGTLDTKYTGSVKIDNIDIYNNDNLSDIRLNKIGFIFQFHHLLPEFTVYENILLPKMILKNNYSIKHNIAELIKLINLSGKENYYPNQLSGGERQRVAVLRALINNPLLVIADEPTGNLDRENSKILLKLMVDLRENYKQSFIIATHDENVKNIADKILYLKDGKINKGKK